MDNENFISHDKSLSAVTSIVAASDSLHPERADYVCDGTDDQVEIQTSNDSLPIDGGKIILLEGNYLFSDKVALSNNVTLEGMGWNTILKAKDSFGNINVVEVISKTNVVIKELNIDGNFANNPRAGTHDDQNGIQIYDSDDCIVTNCYIHDTPDNGIAVDHSSDNNLIFGNKVKSCQWHSIMIWHGSHSNIISSNHCSDGGDIIVEKAGASESKRNIICENVIENSIRFGIKILDSSYVTISSNVINAPTTQGIYIHAGVAPSDTIKGITISNNIISDCPSSSIRLEANAGETIRNCIFSNNVMTGGTIYGFFFAGAGIISHLVFIGNTISEHNGGFQIDSVATINNFIVSNNQIMNLVNWGFFNWSGNKHLIAFNSMAGYTFNGDYSGTIRHNNYSNLFMDVLAVSTTHVRSNEDLSAATPITFTLTAQPDVPRTLSWSFDTHAQITEYDMEVIGVDAKGNSITETWDETAGWSGETSNAFATITSIKITSRTGTGVGDTMDIGITDVLGLSNIIYETPDVFKIKKNNTNVAVATAQVNTTYDTYDMSVIGLGAGDDFTIWYKSNLNIIS